MLLNIHLFQWVSLQKKNLLLLLIFLVNGISLGQTSSATLEDKTAFTNFSEVPLTQKYGEVAAVKFVYDLSAKKLYFINGNRHKLHFDFCTEVLGYRAELEFFNKHNYGGSDKQKYLLGNLNYFKTLNQYALEIAPSNIMDIDQLLLLYRLVEQHTFIGSQLHIFANTPRLQKQLKELQERAPVLLPSAVYENLTYQPISTYKGYGNLRFVSDLKKEENQIQATDIIVLKETPLFLPEVAGILVANFQTPLSHLTILGQNRKIPIAAYTKVFTDSTLLALRGKYVSFKVARDTFYLSPSIKKKRKNKKKRIKLKANLSVDSVVSLAQLKRKAKHFVGNKAANFAMLERLSKQSNFNTPEAAFAIPFYFYNDHVTEHGIDKMIETLLINSDHSVQKDSLRNQLKLIRKAIKSAPISAALLQQVDQKIKQSGNYKRLRFRSSTNAEDAKSFSGAGLYSSKTGIVGDAKKTIPKAIKNVWASLWSYEAFTERAYFEINHREAYMGVLVHRSFPNEAANGVAITKNIYRPGNQGFVVNAQLGEASVVQPKAGVVADQFICYPDNAADFYENTVDIITSSSLTDGRLVLTDEEIKTLANALADIKRYFYRRLPNSKSYLNFAMDIEFKIDGKDRTLYIKQARPYND